VGASAAWLSTCWDVLIVIRWQLATTLMRPMAVVVGEIFVQDRAQVTFAVDQHAVGALGTNRHKPRACPYRC
jgi:hypothetical protein